MFVCDITNIFENCKKKTLFSTTVFDNFGSMLVKKGYEKFLSQLYSLLNKFMVIVI